MTAISPDAGLVAGSRHQLPVLVGHQFHADQPSGSLSSRSASSPACSSPPPNCRPGSLMSVRSSRPALAAALLAAYNPHTTGSGLQWGDLAVLAAWGAAGLIIAVRRFTWLPRGG
jgi:hypothetical protein